MLLAGRGAPQIDRLLRDQIVREKAIEKDFYVGAGSKLDFLPEQN
jgi:hypothetical protein